MFETLPGSFFNKQLEQQVSTARVLPSTPGSTPTAIMTGSPEEARGLVKIAQGMEAIRLNDIQPKPNPSVSPAVCASNRRTVTPRMIELAWR